jgi:hypothetical protein
VIEHFAEVWAMLLVAFFLGCIGGGLLFELMVRTGLAGEQWSPALAGAPINPVGKRLGGTRELRRRRSVAAARSLSVDEGELDPDVDARLQELARDMEEDLPLPSSVETDEFEEDDETDVSHLDRQVMEETGDDEDWAEPAAEEDRAEVRTPRMHPDGGWPESPRRAIPALETNVGRVPAGPTRRQLPPASPVQPPIAARPSPLLGVPVARGGAGASLDVRRPALLFEPRNGIPDNLQRIRGIGARNEVRLNQLGVFHFSQIAAWTPAEVRWIAQQLAFGERIELDDWVGQAVVLASGGETGFTKSAERRRARRRDRMSTDGEPEGGADDEF